MSYFLFVKSLFCLIDDAKVRRFSFDSKFFLDIFLKSMRQWCEFATKQKDRCKTCRIGPDFPSFFTANNHS